MYAFIHIPKTGGSTLRHVLRCSFGARHCDIKVPPKRRRVQPWIGARDLHIARTYYPHLEGICGHRVTCFNGLESAEPHIRYFTFLRDPVRRFISNFQHYIRDSHMPCTEEVLRLFAADPLQRNVMTRMLCGREDSEAAIEMVDRQQVFVGLTQQFDESFCLFAQWLGNTTLIKKFAIRNQASTAYVMPIADTPAWCVMATEANKEDQLLYDHVVQHVYPRLRSAYRGDLNKDVDALRCLNQTHPVLREPVWAKIKRSYLYKPGIHLARTA